MPHSVSNSIFCFEQIMNCTPHTHTHIHSHTHAERRKSTRDENIKIKNERIWTSYPQLETLDKWGASWLEVCRMYINRDAIKLYYAHIFLDHTHSIYLFRTSALPLSIPSSPKSKSLQSTLSTREPDVTRFYWLSNCIRLVCVFPLCFPFVFFFLTLWCAFLVLLYTNLTSIV